MVAKYECMNIQHIISYILEIYLLKLEMSEVALFFMFLISALQPDNTFHMSTVYVPFIALQPDNTFHMSTVYVPFIASIIKVWQGL